MVLPTSPDHLSIVAAEARAVHVVVLEGPEELSGVILAVGVGVEGAVTWRNTYITSSLRDERQNATAGETGAYTVDDGKRHLPNPKHFLETISV